MGTPAPPSPPHPATAPSDAVATDGAGAPKKRISHVVFDMDGLLLDTEGFYSEVQQAILAQHGREFTWELKVRMMGKKALDAARVLVDDTGLGDVLTPEEFLRQREALLHDLFPNSKLMPGAEALVRHLHRHNVPMAIATSSHSGHYALKTLQHGELFSLMHHVVKGDDPSVVNGKPHPDIFLLAASRFEPPPQNTGDVLVFEDAPLGVEAAVRAGMPVVMVPDPRTDRSLCTAATQVLSSLEHFDPSAWGLPPWDMDCAPTGAMVGVGPAAPS